MMDGFGKLWDSSSRCKMAGCKMAGSKRDVPVLTTPPSQGPYLNMKEKHGIVVYLAYRSILGERQKHRKKHRERTRKKQ